MAIKQWGNVALKKEGTGHRDFLNYAKGTIGDSRLVTLLEDPDFYQLLKTQNAMPKAVTWMVSSQWKVAWLWKLLTSPSGGVGGMPCCTIYPLLTSHVVPVAYCSDRATHVSVPQTPYFI